MTNVEWIDMLRVIPEEEQNTLVVVLQNGAEISVDYLFRFEPNFLVLRGRVGGTTDEGRAFFVPYDQMLYYRIERVTNLAELRDILEGRAPQKTEETDVAATTPPPNAPPPVAAGPPDPAAARTALLDRIRAARATQMSAGRMMSH